MTAHSRSSFLEACQRLDGTLKEVTDVYAAADAAAAGAENPGGEVDNLELQIPAGACWRGRYIEWHDLGIG